MIAEYYGMLLHALHKFNAFCDRRVMRLTGGQRGLMMVLRTCDGIVMLQSQPKKPEEDEESAPFPLVVGRQDAAATCSTRSADLALAQHASRDLYVQKGAQDPLVRSAAAADWCVLQPLTAYRLLCQGLDPRHLVWMACQSLCGTLGVWKCFPSLLQIELGMPLMHDRQNSYSSLVKQRWNAGQTLCHTPRKPHGKTIICWLADVYCLDLFLVYAWHDSQNGQSMQMQDNWQRLRALRSTCTLAGAIGALRPLITLGLMPRKPQQLCQGDPAELLTT